MKNQPVYKFTTQGHQDLLEEEQKLNIKRPKVVKNVATAREQGDLSENAGYHAAREELGWIDGRLKEIHYILRFAKVGKGKNDEIVEFGNTITINDGSHDKIYTIVNPMEADPLKGKISGESPIGDSLLGKKVGDSISLDMPDGKTSFKILKIQ